MALSNQETSRTGADARVDYRRSGAEVISEIVAFSYLKQPLTHNKNVEPADCASAGSTWYHPGGGEAGG